MLCVNTTSWSLLLSVKQVRSGETEQEVGKISKQWSGYVKEIFTAADNFGITFPMDLDVKMKACMIVTLFLIVRPSLHLYNECHSYKNSIKS